MTPAERAQYKTKADRVQEIVGTVEALERWRNTTLERLHVVSQVRGVGCVEVVYNPDYLALASRVWAIGIDKLIEQFEQQVADIDRPKAAPSHVTLAAILDDRVSESLAPAADLGNGNLSERQIARYPVVKSASERQKDAAVSLAVWEAAR